MRYFFPLALMAIGGGLFALDYFANFGRPGIWLAPLVLALAAAATWEWLDLARARGYLAPRESALAAALALVVAALVPVVAGWTPEVAQHHAHFFLLPLAGDVIFAALIAALARREAHGSAIAVFALTVFPALYIGLPLALLVALRHGQGNETGMAALVSLLIVVYAVDTGALVAGKLFGRWPLAPRLSPRKTREGAIGGLIAATVAAWVAGVWLVPLIARQPPQALQDSWRWLLYGLAVGIAGLAGDLLESAMKRDAGRKDSSRWWPGGGGVLDLVDSLLVAIIPAYSFWMSGLVAA